MTDSEVWDLDWSDGDIDRRYSAGSANSLAHSAGSRSSLLGGTYARPEESQPTAPRYTVAPGAAQQLLLEDLGQGQQRMEGVLETLQQDMTSVLALLRQAHTSMTSNTLLSSFREPPAETGPAQQKEAEPSEGAKLSGTEPGRQGRDAEEPAVVADERQAHDRAADSQQRLSVEDTPSFRPGRHVSEDCDLEDLVHQEPTGMEHEGTQALIVAPSLPMRWPTCIRIRHEAAMAVRDKKEKAIKKASKATTLKGVGAATNLAMHNISKSLSGAGVAGSTCPMIDPNSNFHVVYSVLLLIVVTHDLALIPFTLAWDLQLTGALNVCGWISTGFWTLDILVSFRTGYVTKDHVELGPLKVALHYLKTWFLPDITVSTCNWVSLSLELAIDESSPDSSIGTLKIVRFARLGKLLRIAGLLRLMKVVRLVEELIETSMSETNRICLRCAGVLFLTLWLNHLTCCLWWAIGFNVDADTGMRWVNASQRMYGEEKEFMSLGVMYQYITALHWSVAQFTLGANDVVCYNSSERIYNIFCLMLGLIFGTTLVSSLSATMVDYQMTRKDQIQKLRKLRRFLRENNVNPSVAHLVTSQATERLGKQEKIFEKDVDVLNLISRSLRAELRWEIYEGFLKTHPLFTLWCSMDCGMARRICFESLGQLFLRPQDDLFLAATETDKAYYLNHGSITYMQDPESAPVVVHTVQLVEKSTWMSEASLWSHWIHVGTAKAESKCEIVTMDGQSLSIVYHRAGDIRNITMQYCQRFHHAITHARPPAAPWPNDLEVPFADYADIVAGMHKEVQVIISLHSIEQAISRHWRMGRAHLPVPHHAPGHHWGDISLGVKTNYTKLKEEAIEGRSCLTLCSDGHLERIVLLMALQLESSDGRLFVELGSVDKEARVHAACQLPFAELGVGEVKKEALRKLLARWNMCEDEVIISKIEREEEWMYSKEFGVQTRYVRIVNYMKSLQEQVMLPVVVMPNSNDKGRGPRNYARGGPDRHGTVSIISNGASSVSTNHRASTASVSSQSWGKRLSTASTGSAAPPKKESVGILQHFVSATRSSMRTTSRTSSRRGSSRGASHPAGRPTVDSEVSSERPPMGITRSLALGRDLEEAKVYKAYVQGKIHLYTWLYPSRFNFLRGEGEGELNAWLTALSLSELDLYSL